MASANASTTVVVRGPRMVAREDRSHECAVDRATVLGAELGQLLAPLRQRRAALARPHEGIEGEAFHPFGMALGEGGRAQRARRDAVDEERPRAARLEDVVGGGRKVVGAGGDVGIDVAALVGAAVAFHVDGPGVETLRREEVHSRGIGDARHREVEGRLRSHRRAVHEQDRAGLLGRAGAFLPQEQPDVALRRPMLLPLNGGRPADRLVHCAAPGCSGGCLPSAP